MRCRRLGLGVMAGLWSGVLVVSVGVPGAGAATGPGHGAGGGGGFVLTARSTGAGYAPTFTGNGFLGVRVPPAGQGYAGGQVPTQSQVAGFYAQPAGQVQQRANAPTWSTLRFVDGGRAFSMTTGRVSGWRQSLDLRTGVIRTQATWRAPDGHRTRIRYAVFTDRARPYVGVVRLRLTPLWSGRASVIDLVDGRPATLTTGLAKGWDPARAGYWETVRTKGTGITAGLASRLGMSGDVRAGQPGRVGAGNGQSVGQRVTFEVHRGRTYTFTKYVGLVTSTQQTDPGAVARRQAGSARSAGFARLLEQNDARWARLWAGRVQVLGDRTLATEVNASQFYLWSSTRRGSDWSLSPAGLSSNGYDGHIFWDAETWMFPSLLAQHPALAKGVNTYRYQRLGAAQAHARATGYQGARFPWESALDGTEQIPPPASVNSEGLYEQHITADVALAQWQYYLATGDRAWLVARGWPVLSQAARFWASRVQPGAHGRYHIRGVTGPDEENPDVNDEVYTNVAAATTLRIATRAAAVVGAHAPSSWARIAAGLVVLFDPARQVHPEFAGYQGQMVKQADVTMLQYPWQRSMPAIVATRDLDYYVPRTDPGGPSMSDAINSIDSSALGTPGCSAFVYTQRSVQPFIRDVFDQFSETRTGGAFTFTTGIGGFLQEFLYGYSGLRWDATAPRLDPTLSGRLTGIVLHRLRWHGRVFTVSIGQARTRVRLDRGRPLPIRVSGTTRHLTRGHPLVVATRRPDQAPTTDRVRCADATASSAQPGADPLAAVDGSPATDWQPTSTTAQLTVPLTRSRTATLVDTARLRWGRKFPSPPAPNVPPPPTPVLTLRASSYDLLTSTNDRTWHVVARVRGRASGTQDVLRFHPVRARFVRLVIHAATHHTPPMLEELTVTDR